MIKMSVLYPHSSEARFDHDYYRDHHMPLAQRLLGEACLFYEIDKGLGGGEPGSPPAYVAMCHIYCPSLEAFQAGIARHGAAIQADIVNYTDVTPVVVISEAVVAPPIAALS